MKVMKKIMTAIIYLIMAVGFTTEILAATTNANICNGATYTWNGQPYTTTGTYIAGTDTLVLTVNPLPTPTLTFVGSICDGNAGNDTLFIQFNATPSTITIQQNGSTLYSGAYISIPYYPGSVNAGTYSLIATTQTGCTDSTHLTINPCPPILYDTIIQSICQGDSISFDNQIIGVSGTYQRSFVSNGVIDSIHVLILTVNPKPKLNTYVNGDSSICNGIDSLFAYISNSVSAQILWKFNGNTVGSGYGYHPTTAGIYTAIAYGTCGNDTATFALLACVPTTTISQSICQGDSIFFGNQWIKQTGAYQHLFTDSSGAVDSVHRLHLTVNTMPQLSIGGYSYYTGDTSFCYNPNLNSDSVVLYAQTNFLNQITWILNANIVGNGHEFNPTAAGTYTVIATNSCGPNTTTYTLLPCLSDSVWPGDANHNGIADNNDLLPIGIAYGLGGASRPNASIVWQGAYCTDWGLQLLTGTNAKHIDCNGDGIINANDTLAVIQNYGLTHNKTGEERKPARSGIPGLHIVMLRDTLLNGNTMMASIRLGTPNEPVSDIYGLAFTYNFDPKVIDTSSVSFDFTDSWLGNNTDKISLAKNFGGLGIIKTAVTRIDHANRSGNGEIATFRAIITTDNINGKDLFYYTTSHFISGLTAIDKDENIVELNEGIDSAQIGYYISGINETRINDVNWLLFPNPANGKITIKSTENIEGIEVWNVLGERVYAEANIKQTAHNIELSGLANGVYIAQIETAKGIGKKRFIISK